MISANIRVLLLFLERTQLFYKAGSLFRFGIFCVGITALNILSAVSHPYAIGYVNSKFLKAMSMKHEINFVWLTGFCQNSSHVFKVVT